MFALTQQSKCPRRFWELDPGILHACLMCPCRAFYECFFFSPNVGSPKTPKNTKTKTEKKQSFVEGSAGAHSTRVQNCRVLTLKNGVDIDRRLKEFGFLCLNQPVLIRCCAGWMRAAQHAILGAQHFSPQAKKLVAAFFFAVGEKRNWASFF